MDVMHNWATVAEECEALARLATHKINRDALMAAAARWRRMARVAVELDAVKQSHQKNQQA